MADATDYIKNQFVNWLTDAQSFDSPPGDIYVALHDGDPGSDASNNEISASGYSRYQSSIPSDWDQPSTGNFENANDFLYSQATSDWGTVSHFSLWDGPNSTDNALAQDSLSSNVTINDGDAPVFRAGNLSGTFS